METSPLSLRLAWPAGEQRIRAALGEQESQQTFYFEHTPRGNYDHLAYGLANTPQALFLTARAVKLIIIQPAAHGLARNGPFVIEQGKPGAIAVFPLLHPCLTACAFRAHAIAQGGAFRRRIAIVTLPSPLKAPSNAITSALSGHLQSLYISFLHFAGLAPSHRRSLGFIVCTPRYSGACPRASNCAKS